MKRYLFFLLLLPFALQAQNYTSYFNGNATDAVTTPLGGVCLMGGATEDDSAMTWFLQRANGGDILVLRTTGTNGYNNYMYSTLGVAVNSVETIVCTSAAASYDPYVLQKVQQAEAIWFAGGDQWTYISSWRNTPVDSLINKALQQKHIVIGGTSAGMAIQGHYYFSAQVGSVTSAAALANPYTSLVTVDSSSFISTKYMADVITDTHFDNPDRKGRLMTFLARIQSDYGQYAKAIACDEYTCVCIDTNGIAKVYGGYPTYDDNAYFVQSNCELLARAPENCTSGFPLNWNLGGQAIKVYKTKGTPGGSNTFNLNDWQSGVGGTWLNWSVNNGNFLEQNGNPINCAALGLIDNSNADGFSIYPIPSNDKVIIYHPSFELKNAQVALYTNLGQKLAVNLIHTSAHSQEISLLGLEKGMYYLKISYADNKQLKTIIVKN